jgi:hypothetical protein
VFVDGPGQLADLVLDERVADRASGDGLGGLPPGSIGPRGDLAALLAQDSTDRLDRVALGAHLFDERDDQRSRGSSSPAKKIDALRRISLSCSRRRTLALSSLISASSSVVGPWRWSPSIWAWTTQRRTVSFPRPSRRATASAAADSDGYSCWTPPFRPYPRTPRWPGLGTRPRRYPACLGYLTDTGERSQQRTDDVVLTDRRPVRGRLAGVPRGLIISTWSNCVAMATSMSRTNAPEPTGPERVRGSLASDADLAAPKLFSWRVRLGVPVR